MSRGTSFIPESNSMKAMTRPLITMPATYLSLVAEGILILSFAAGRRSRRNRVRRSLLWVSPLLLRALQKRDDRHGVAMAEAELFLQNSDDGAHLHPGD